MSLNNTIRIAITGPESTGKSSLTIQLAHHYKALFVEEYAREYIDALDRPYCESDILEIARVQIANENQTASQGSRLLFCDTELTVCKIWSDVKYKRCHQWIEQQMASHTYQLYLLMDIDLEWHDDPQREHPHLREYLFNLYKTNLTQRGVNYKTVSGIGNQRLKCAIDHIDTFLLNQETPLLSISHTLNQKTS